MESHSRLSMPVSVTPTPSLLQDDEIRNHLIATASAPDSFEELELSSLIHTNPPGLSNLEDTEDPSQNTTASSADDDGHPATGTDETAISTEMSAPAPISSRPIFPWLSEAGCLAVAIAALIATIVVLAKFDSQEQPHWPYANMLNLSALIAILATLLRSMVTLILEALIGQLKWYWYGRVHPVAHLQVFEDASHGAWGSSKFLYQIHEADWPSVSAIFMVLSIGIGTFTQLALRTTPCSKAVPHAVASIPTSKLFPVTTLESVPFRYKTEYITQSRLTLDILMETAVISGLSGLQSLVAGSASCDTGNCSFPSYSNRTHSTLGIESMCIDVSPFLIQTDNSTISPGNGETENLYGPPSDGPGTNKTFVWTNYTFPGEHPPISYLAEGDDNGWGRWYPLVRFDTNFVGMLPPGPWRSPTLNTSYYDISPSLSPQEEYLAQRSFYIQTFMVPTLNPCLERSTYPPSGDPLPLINTSSCPQLGMTNVSTFPGYFTMAAVQCHLYPSIRHYAGSIINGQIQEKLIGDPVPLNLGTNATRVGILFEDYDLLYYAFLDPCIIEGTVYTNANISQVPGEHITMRWLDDSEVTGPILCLYGVPSTSLVSLAGSLQTSGLAQPGEDDYSLNACVPNIDYTSMKCPSTWWLEPLLNGGNASFESISAVISRMADAITNQLRMNGTDFYGNPSNVTGTAFQTVVCTQFQWGWLLFPAAVVLASAVLLVATAWRSSSRWGRVRANRGGSQVEVPVWKSSLLPLMFYGLEDGARLRGPPVENKAMSELAGEIVARLSLEQGELRFRSARPAPREKKA